MREKAEEKTRNNLNHAIKVVADVLQKEQAVDIAKHIIDKAAERDETDEELQP
jgi:20S proteasome alpha/beta subunit